MRSTLTLMTALALLIVVASAGLAQSADPAAKPAAKPAATQVDPSAALQLRAKMHRTMADLMEARAAEKPDQQKIADLVAKLQQLRGEMQAQAPAAPVGPGWRCPWGGPGMGPGPGYGRGPGGGRGPGYGRGQGWGGGPGGGRGQGWGGGPGYGRGAGLGAGAGWGPGFVDRDGDGICDNLQQRTGQK